MGDEDGLKNTPLLSVKDGKVEEIGYDDIGGYWLLIKHNAQEYAYYGHLKPNSIKVSVGNKISQGTILAIMGNSGKTNGIYHVHFEIRKTPKFLSDIDPSPIFGKNQLKQDEYFKVTSKIKNNRSYQQNCSSYELKGNNNIEKMWFFFKSKGYTDEAVSGIIGSAMAESGPELDPKMQQIGGPARGIFQWESRRKELNGNYLGNSDNRFDKLYDWAKAHHKDPFSIENQLEYAYLEMTNPSYDITTYTLLMESQFKKITSIAEATKRFTQAFERAGVEVLEKRITYAQSVYKLMKNKK